MKFRKSTVAELASDLQKGAQLPLPSSRQMRSAGSGSPQVEGAMGLQPNSSSTTMVAPKGPLAIAHLLVSCTALSKASCLGHKADYEDVYVYVCMVWVYGCMPRPQSQ